jgi:hypothetical protein
VKAKAKAKARVRARVRAKCKSLLKYRGVRALTMGSDSSEAHDIPL